MTPRAPAPLSPEEVAIAREIYALNFACDPDGEPRHGYASWDSGVGHPFFEAASNVTHARRCASRVAALLRGQPE